MKIKRVFIGSTILVAASILLLVIHFHSFSSYSTPATKPRFVVNRELQERKIRKPLTVRQIDLTKHNTFKLVLFYTPLFGRLPWRGLESSYNFTHFLGKPCAVRNCKISYDKRDFKRSDAVIFHGNDIPNIETMTMISTNRSVQQRWIYFTHENPVFTYHDVGQYNTFFNWTMSYRRDSDFFVPYHSYRRLNPEEKANLQVRENYAEGKYKLIAWMVGNCGQLRDKVVGKLLQYVKIDVFGGCASKFNQTNHCLRGSQDCEKTLKQYKFYLSFENAMCVDYVTEKYWFNPLVHDMVPVVLGANYDVAIPGSYINVIDFPTIKALSDYLKYLNGNDTAYNQYFQWKKKFQLDYPPSWTCQMCADLNNKSLPAKVYGDLGSFWGKNSSCGKNRDKIYKLLQI